MKLVVELLWFIIHLLVSEMNGYQSVKYDELEMKVNDYLNED